jgi:serine phosphatase RsbU (regulator of sigma subunit)
MPHPIGRRERKELLPLFETENRFKVFVAGRGMLCPYCREILGLTSENPARIDKALEHLGTACRVFAGLGTAPSDYIDLVKKKEAIESHDEIEVLIRSDAAWRVVDHHGTWYCPCCAQPTTVKYLAKEKGDKEALLRDINKHLRSCYDYGQDPGRTHSAEELRGSIAAVRREETLAAEISARVAAGDKAFCQKDPDGTWICPYCLQVVAGLSIGTELLLHVNGPMHMARHRVQGCPADAAAQPHPEQAVINVAVGLRHARLDKELAKAEKKTENTAYISALRQEMLAIRQDIAVNDELKKSLEKAHSVVTSMLPARIPKPPGYEINTFYQACTEVGGDFYDFIDLPENRTGVVMGDVSGHGLEAALVMGMAKKAINVRAKSGADPRTTMIQANGDICPDLERNTFVTVFYGILDAVGHTMTFARAGHNFALVYRAAGRDVEVLQSGGMSVGITTGPLFGKALTAVTTALEPGDVFMQYTDGLVEAMNAQGDEFGMAQFADTLRAYGHLATGIAVTRLMEDVQRFMAGHPQQDDICIVVVRRLPVQR